MSVWLSATGPKDAPAARPPVTPAPAHDADRAGVAGTLDDLVRTHLPGLIRYATVLVGDQHTAADLVQEVLLRAHQRWHRIALTERPDLYLRRMVTNEHLSWRRRWHVRMVRPTADDALVGHAGAAADHAENHAREDAMWHRLAQLPARQRTVLVLRYYEGLADVDIAAVLGTSPATVRSHASRALTTLRRTDPNFMETR